MNMPLAIVIDMTKNSVAIPVYIATALVVTMFLWFFLSPRVPLIGKAAIACLLSGLWLYSDATARNWQKVTLPNGKTTIIDLYVHSHSYIVATSILGVFLILVSVALAVFDWRRNRNKIQQSGAPNHCSPERTHMTEQDSEHPRGNQPTAFFLRTATCLLVFASVVSLCALLTVRFHHWDVRPWLFCRGPVSILLLAFILRVLFSCSWKHLLSSLPFLAALLFVLAQRLLHLDFDQPDGYVAVGVLLALVTIPALIGMTVGGLTVRRMASSRSRCVAVAVAAVLLFGWPAGHQLGWRAYAWFTSAHAESMGKPTLRANARELKHTLITPTLDAPLSDGTNVLWCATFQMAWNELVTLAGEDIHMVQEAAMVDFLNRKSITKVDLDETTYVATASAAGAGGTEKIWGDLNVKFNGRAAPQLLPPAGALPPDAVIVYAYLFANLPFQWAFDRLEKPFSFRGSEVKAFGITQYLKSQKKKRLAAGQLKIFYPSGLKGVIVELKTRRQDHRLLLAKVPRLATLAETVRSVLSSAAATQPQELSEWENFAIPIMDFDLNREFTEIIGKPLRVAKPPLAGVPIALAQQQIRFKLDERGALLKSEAVIATLGSAPSLTFDSPFLVLLMYAKSERPYFALWVDNSELLTPF